MKSLFKSAISITHKEIVFLVGFVIGQCSFLLLALSLYKIASHYGAHDGGLFAFGILVGLDLAVIVSSAVKMSKL
jgi:hypothetical protein